MFVGGSVCASRRIQYVASAEARFKRSRSFPIARMIIPVGVNTAKKSRPITIGFTIRCRSNPNLNQAVFKGDSRTGFKRAEERNASPRTRDSSAQNGRPSSSNSHTDNKVSITAKVMPNDLSDGGVT